MTGPTAGPVHAPRVSVVTVVLDDLAGLRSTWDSVRAQTAGELEWVVVDGGSSDGAVAWLRSLDDERVRWSSGPDRGIYDALSIGAARARGDLVVFLNAGDRLASERVLADVDGDQRAHGWSWAYGIARVVDERGDLVQVSSFVPFDLRRLELGERSICHQSAFFTRALVQDLGRFADGYGVHADQEYFARAARTAPPRLLGDVVCDFRSGGASWGGAPDAFLRQARRMRRAHGRLLGGSEVLDAAVTTLLRADARARHLAHRTLTRRRA